MAPQRSSTKKDEYLFGLLSTHKSDNTFVKVGVSEETNTIAVMLTNNPKNWSKVSDEKYKNLRELRRLEIGSPKLFIKFLLPEQLVKVLGPSLKLKLPDNQVRIIDDLKENGYYILSVPLKYKKRVLSGVNKLLELKPQKKYEIIEKYLIEDQDI